MNTSINKKLGMKRREQLIATSPAPPLPHRSATVCWWKYRRAQAEDEAPLVAAVQPQGPGDEQRQPQAAPQDLRGGRKQAWAPGKSKMRRRELKFVAGGGR